MGEEMSRKDELERAIHDLRRGMAKGMMVKQSVLKAIVVLEALIAYVEEARDEISGRTV